MVEKKPIPPSPPPDREYRPDPFPTRVVVMMILLVLLLVLLLSSCSPKVITTTSEVKDSVRVEYVPREVLVQLPGDTVQVVQWIECDSTTNKPKPFTVKAKSSRSKLNLKVNSSGELTATASCDSLQQIVNVLDKEVFRLRHESSKNVEVVTQYKTRRIDIICRWYAGLSVLMLILFVVLKFYRIL